MLRRNAEGEYFWARCKSRNTSKCKYCAGIERKIVTDQVSSLFTGMVPEQIVSLTLRYETATYNDGELDLERTALKNSYVPKVREALRRAVRADERFSALVFASVLEQDSSGFGLHEHMLAGMPLWSPELLESFISLLANLRSRGVQISVRYSRQLDSWDHLNNLSRYVTKEVGNGRALDAKAFKRSVYMDHFVRSVRSNGTHPSLPPRKFATIPTSGFQGRKVMLFVGSESGRQVRTRAALAREGAKCSIARYNLSFDAGQLVPPREAELMILEAENAITEDQAFELLCLRVGEPDEPPPW